MRSELHVGDRWWGKKIREIVRLSNGWYVIKTENRKSEKDFKVKTIFSLKPRHSLTPKHAHFAIDFYGKLYADREGAMDVFKAVIEMWGGKTIEELLAIYREPTQHLPGYPLEYILYALRWILEQEDINFRGRPEKKQKQLDEICNKQDVTVPKGRLGSQLACSLLCNIASGKHPVDALLDANLDVLPRKRM